MTEAQSRPTGPDREQPEAVGKYRVIRRLGEGGMGSVFLAEDTVLRRNVALKLPLSGTEDDPEVRERFLREARSAATLDHPYICRVHDAGEVDGRLYLAMAYVEGKSLADLVRSEGMPPRQVVALVGKLAIALQEAHTRGVVHRDLKPGNVMIRTAGSRREPVIVDFGLARLQGPEDVRMTRTGQVMGTPAYMAPEQLLGKPEEVGPACDIYALGVILYELLTGQLPFSGGGSYAVLVAQILTQPPQPLSTHRPGLDTALDAICRKAMAKGVSERYGSMMELASALTEYLKNAPAVSIPGRPGTPIIRPIEGDSIPTGADTLVSQLLGNREGSRVADLVLAVPASVRDEPGTSGVATAPPAKPGSWRIRAGSSWWMATAGAGIILAVVIAWRAGVLGPGGVGDIADANGPTERPTRVDKPEDLREVNSERPSSGKRAGIKGAVPTANSRKGGPPRKSADLDVNNLMRTQVVMRLARLITIFSPSYARSAQTTDEAKRGTSYVDVFKIFLPKLQALKEKFEADEAAREDLRSLIEEMKQSKAYTDTYLRPLNNGSSEVGQKHFRGAVRELEELLRMLSGK